MLISILFTLTAVFANLNGFTEHASNYNIEKVVVESKLTKYILFNPKQYKVQVIVKFLANSNPIDLTIKLYNSYHPHIPCPNEEVIYIPEENKLVHSFLCIPNGVYDLEISYLELPIFQVIIFCI